MTDCNHISRVKEWGYNLIDGDMKPYVKVWDCINCDDTSSEPFKTENIFVDHSGCADNPCFGCKAKYLQMSVGDARHDGVMSAKQHDKELGSYFDTVRQGIEPISTKTKDIQAAVRLSNDMGVAFDGNKL